MNLICENCYFYDRCDDSGDICEYYTDINENIFNNIDTYIEHNRTEFYKEWFRYIEENEQ